ncbi:hypothetical protein E2C01_047675 [Portunus trituberculatus]|uniref:Uncharacterized protein n=1 Tax=Portunus trituberculatus TaxID=210409 RepID=A0A5B7G8J1_PORTR|nr:hypothetical protein [Portunus trituberculatus]
MRGRNSPQYTQVPRAKISLTSSCRHWRTLGGLQILESSVRGGMCPGERWGREDPPAGRPRLARPFSPVQLHPASKSVSHRILVTLGSH